MTTDPTSSPELTADPTAAPKPRLSRALAAGVGVLTALVWAWVCARIWTMTIDDSGISYAYARWWAEGWGLTYGPGGYVVEGYSNFTWVLLLTLAELVGWGAEGAGKVLGSAAGFGAMLLCAWAGRLAGGRERAGWRWWDAVPLLLLVGTLQYVTWAQSGLENGLYALLMMAGCASVMWERAHPERWPWSAPLVVALALTRPDGLMYGIILGGYKLLGALTDRRGGRQLAWFFAVSLGGWGLYQAWHWAVFADALPNTYYSKRPGDDHAREGLAYLKKNMAGGAWALPWGLAALGIFVERSWERLLLGGLLAAWVFFVLMVGGDWMPGGRFISFGLPFLALLAHQGVERLDRWRAWLVARLGWAADGRAARGSAGVLAALVLGACGWWAVTQSQATVTRWSKTGWCHYCEVKDRARGLKAASGKHELGLTSALTFDFGGFAWEATPGFLPVDYLGLCDPIIARINAINDSVSRGQAKLLYDHHVFEELGELPTFIYLPRRWWAVQHAREYHESYVDITRHARAWMGAKGHRPDARLGVSRMAWVHLYPPVNKALYTPLGHDLVVLGTRRQGDRVGVAIVPVGAQARRVQAVHVRTPGGKTSVKHELFGGLDEVRASWKPGEPYWLEVVLPGEGERVEVGVTLSATRAARGVAGAPKTWTLVEARAPDASLPGWHMPRNPAHWQGPRDEALRRLQARLWALDARRREAKDWTIHDAALARELAAAGARLEGAGDTAQAYLAHVGALRADRAQASRHYKKIIATRPRQLTSDWALERELVLRMHASRGAAREVRWLLDHLSARGLSARESYVRARLSARSSANAATENTNKLSSYKATPWTPLLKNASFEGGAFDGWTVKGDAFGRAPSAWTDDLTRRVRGIDGARFATSYARGRDRDRGELLSPEFTITGDAISLLVAGGSRAKTAVELLVDGRVVLSARGDQTRAMRPVIWEVAAWRGKTARVRLRDEDTGPWGWIAADHFRQLPATGQEAP